jgi:hypothetical protein
VQTIEVRYWDDPNARRKKMIPAVVAVTITVQVTAIDPAAAALARKVTIGLELSEDSLQDLMGEQNLGPWIEYGHKPAAGNGAGRGGTRPAHARLKEVRAFADALGRSQEYISPSWTEDMGSRNKYTYPQTLTGDYDTWAASENYARWAADGRPPLQDWRPLQDWAAGQAATAPDTP